MPALSTRICRVLASLALASLVITSFAPAGASANQPQPMPPNPRVKEMIERGEVQEPQMIDQIDASALRTESMAAPEALAGSVRALAVLVDFSDNVKTVQASFFDSLIFGDPVSRPRLRPGLLQ